MIGEDGWPSRDDVTSRWIALIEGLVTREEVHDWTVPWVEGEGDVVGPPSDVMVGTALQNLHGFTMAYLPETPNLIHHGPPGIYVKSLDDIKGAFEWWLGRCREWDQRSQPD